MCTLGDFATMYACGDEFVSLVEGAASRLANDDIFLAETKVATFAGVGVWFTPLQNIPCD